MGLLRRIHAKKTGCLIRASLELGARWFPPLGISRGPIPSRPSLVLGAQQREMWKDFLDLAYWNVELDE